MLYISHHGILGQKWGVRNGPPYPLSGGDYTAIEKEKIYRKRKKLNSIYNKRHFDDVLKKNKTTLTTFSYDKDRTKNTDMFYAVHDKLDVHLYNALFNKKVPNIIYDENGNNIGTGMSYKVRINNKIYNDMKVASEDSSAKIFMELYKKDRDFYNFVTDPSRMEKHFIKEKYKFKGYREAKKILDEIKNPNHVVTDKDLKTIYRFFNYVIPSDGLNKMEKKDILTQRAKFFNILKKNGYGALLDTNDAIYGGFKANSPIIVFDIEQIIPKNIMETTTMSKNFSSFVLIGMKLLGI